jgi:ribosomal RNA-processing protein 12
MGLLPRLKRSTKGKQWGKGHSSSSNPSSHKFRDQAKARRIGLPSKSSALTTEALARHDESDISMSVDYDRSVTAGSRKTGSVKSGWTIGSDISCAFDATAFQHLRKLCNSSLESHRQICAVLAAVTEVIKSQGGSQTDMEYFAALV